MKALQLVAHNRLDIVDLPRPEPGPDEVLIAVRACGICGSDVHGLDGSTGRRRPPIVMGHEAAGIIAALGSQVKGWSVGARVTFDSTIFCGQCEHCRRGEVNLCDSRRVLGVSCEDYRQAGAFAEFLTVPARILYALPQSLSFEDAALIEPFAIAAHALRRAPVTLNDTAAIIGCGMIGIALVQLARIAGYGRIIAVDTARDRLDVAGRLGASDLVLSEGEQTATSILELTGGRGVDRVFEAVGVAATVSLAVRAARRGGQVTLVGNVAPSVPLALQAVVTRELTLHGTCASAGEYPACLDLMARGLITAKPLLSAVAPLAEGAAWFKRLYEREPGLMKVVLVP
jgi:L-iditol 2-dehydrogenase